MRLLRIAAGMVLGCGGLSATTATAERPRVVVESLAIESHRWVLNEARTPEHPGNHVSRLLPVAVTVYRPDDDRQHPALVYLHGGGTSFADPVMKHFHAELASRGLVVLAPHYLLDGTGWPAWTESATNTVTLAAELPSVDSGRIGIAGLSMGGQIGLSLAARDHRIKAVAEFFTAWPGSLPDEPIGQLPPVLLLNGTADPVIPFEKAMVLDGLLEDHQIPFERHAYAGLGHGFGTAAAFADGLTRTAAFFGADLAHPAEPTAPHLQVKLAERGPMGAVNAFANRAGDPFATAPASTSAPVPLGSSRMTPPAKRRVKRLVVNRPPLDPSKPDRLPQ